MAAVTKSGTPSPCSPAPSRENTLPSGAYAGEAIAAGDACYLKSDGKVWLGTGAAANAAAVVVGFAPQAYAVGDPCTLYWDMNFYYGSGLTPGALLYLSGTVPGGLDTATSTGGTTAIAQVLYDGIRIYVQKSF